MHLEGKAPSPREIPRPDFENPEDGLVQMLIYQGQTPPKKARAVPPVALWLRVSPEGFPTLSARRASTQVWGRHAQPPSGLSAP